MYVYHLLTYLQVLFLKKKSFFVNFFFLYRVPYRSRVHIIPLRYSIKSFSDNLIEVSIQAPDGTIVHFKKHIVLYLKYRYLTLWYRTVQFYFWNIQRFISPDYILIGSSLKKEQIHH